MTHSLRLPVRLRVLRVNEAVGRFCARHGFVITSEANERLVMARMP